MPQEHDGGPRRTRSITALVVAGHIALLAALDPDSARDVALRADRITDHARRSLRLAFSHGDPAFDAEVLRLAKTGKLAQSDMGDLLLRQELTRNGFSQEEYERAKEKLDALTQRFREQAAREPDRLRVLHDMAQEQGRYSRPRATLTDLLLGEGGDCDAAARLMLALVPRVYPDLPVELERYADHVRALVVVNGVTYALQKPTPVVVSAEERARTETLPPDAYLQAYARQLQDKAPASTSTSGYDTDTTIDLSSVGTRKDLPKFQEGPVPAEELEDVRMSYEEAGAMRRATEAIPVFPVSASAFIEYTGAPDEETTERGSAAVETMVESPEFQRAFEAEVVAYAREHGLPEVFADYGTFTRGRGTVRPHAIIIGVHIGADRRPLVDAGIVLGHTRVAGEKEQFGQHMAFIRPTLDLQVPEEVPSGNVYDMERDVLSSDARAAVMSAIEAHTDALERVRPDAIAFVYRPDIDRRITAELIRKEILGSPKLKAAMATEIRSLAAQSRLGYPRVAVFPDSLKVQEDRRVELRLHFFVTMGHRNDAVLQLDVLAPSSLPTGSSFSLWQFDTGEPGTGKLLVASDAMFDAITEPGPSDADRLLGSEELDAQLAATLGTLVVSGKWPELVAAYRSLREDGRAPTPIVVVYSAHMTPDGRLRPQLQVYLQGAVSKAFSRNLAKEVELRIDLPATLQKGGELRPSDGQGVQMKEAERALRESLALEFGPDAV